MTEQTSRTLLGGQTQLDVRSIERELMQLWRSAGEHLNGEGSTVTRTCVLNLLVVSPPGYDATPVIARLTDALPSRAIVIIADESAPQGDEPLLDAWVQAHCQLPAPGRPQVCCEQITLQARGDGVGRVPGTVLPLLVPDVPVAVWYPSGEPFDNILFNRLTQLADRVIVDTSTFNEPVAGFERLATRSDVDPAQADLVWGRLTVWREQVAQCFDAPALAARLSEAQRLTIVGGRGRNLASAWLLAGWLASRLNWHDPVRARDGALELQREGGMVRVEVGEGGRESPQAQAIEQISLACEGVTGTVAVSGVDRIVTTTAVPGRPPLTRNVRLPQRDHAELLADELRLPVSDPTYVAALRATVGLLAARDATG